MNTKNFFTKYGFVVLKNFIPPNICDDALKKFNIFNKFLTVKKNKEIVIEKIKGKNSIKYFKNIDYYIGDFKRFYSNKILDLASNLISNQVYYLNMGLHNKPPGSIEGTPPHQDNFYWCRKPSDALTAYVALTEQSYENGGIGYLKKSHLSKLHTHHKSKVKAFSSYIKLNKKYYNDFFFPKLSIGDVVFHHCKTIHISAPNKTLDKNRTSLAITIYGNNTKLDKLKQKKYLSNFNK